MLTESFVLAGLAAPIAKFAVDCASNNAQNGLPENRCTAARCASMGQHADFRQGTLSVVLVLIAMEPLFIDSGAKPSGSGGQGAPTQTAKQPPTRRKQASGEGDCGVYKARCGDAANNPKGYRLAATRIGWHWFWSVWVTVQRIMKCSRGSRPQCGAGQSAGG